MMMHLRWSVIQMLGSSDCIRRAHVFGDAAVLLLPSRLMLVALRVRFPRRVAFFHCARLLVSPAAHQIAHLNPVHLAYIVKSPRSAQDRALIWCGTGVRVAFMWLMGGFPALWWEHTPFCPEISTGDDEEDDDVHSASFKASLYWLWVCSKLCVG